MGSTYDTLLYEGNKDIHIWFTVPKEWADKWKDNYDLDDFDNEYTWDDSIEMYWSAVKDEVIVNEERI